VNERPRRVTPALLARWPLPDMSRAEGKEARGRVLIVGGSRPIPGAVLLAGIAALRAGAGKLQIATANEAAIALAIALPEAKVIGVATGNDGEIRSVPRSVREAAQRTDALLIGPGMLESKQATRLATALTRTCEAPVVLDAGALPACLERNDRLRIVTPHAGEMASLLGIDIEDVEADSTRVARDFAQESGAIVVLKGADTCIAAPDGRAWLHTGGSIGLGTSGSGDVLAGVIAGLVARGCDPAQAAVWGVALHGRAGARLSKRHATIGFLAREIAWELPWVLPD
jgi:hydroxyethylthiazole kinase-like uncharacterized protein yjeF